MSTPTKSQSMSDRMDTDFPMNVTYEEDGSITFEWDEYHPVTSVFNDWKEEDFVRMLMDASERVLSENEPDKTVEHGESE